MKNDHEHMKEIYESPRVLATYEKEELEDAIGIDPEVAGTVGGGCGCGCGCGSIL